MMQISRKIAGLVLCALFTLPAMATEGDNNVEVFQLQNRSPDQLIPVISPMVPGAVMQAYQGQLIVKGSAETIATVKKLLASLDTPQKNLHIQLKQVNASVLDPDEFQVCGNVQSQSVQFSMRCAKGQDDGMVLQTLRNNEILTQDVRVLSGEVAEIKQGFELPYVTSGDSGGGSGNGTTNQNGMSSQGSGNSQSGNSQNGGDNLNSRGDGNSRNGKHSHQHNNSNHQPNSNTQNNNYFDGGIAYKPVMSGFYVQPTLENKDVVIKISASRQQLSQITSGEVQTQNTVTKLRVPLNTWVNIGGTSSGDDSNDNAVTLSTRRANNGETSVWIKVEVIDATAPSSHVGYQ